MLCSNFTIAWLVLLPSFLWEIKLYRDPRAKKCKDPGGEDCILGRGTNPNHSVIVSLQILSIDLCMFRTSCNPVARGLGHPTDCPNFGLEYQSFSKISWEPKFHKISPSKSRRPSPPKKIVYKYVNVTS